MHRIRDFLKTKWPQKAQKHKGKKNGLSADLLIQHIYDQRQFSGRVPHPLIHNPAGLSPFCAFCG